MSSIEDLIINNRQYAESFTYGSLGSPPSRRLAVVTCMDARIDVHRILGLSPGEAHIIRNAGGIVTDDVVRSLMISQVILGTKSIMIIQHTNCGMMSSEDDIKGRIESAIGVRPTFALHTFKDLEEEVRNNVARIKASPFIPNKDDVRGFVYDVKSGLLHEVS